MTEVDRDHFAVRTWRAHSDSGVKTSEGSKRRRPSKGIRIEASSRERKSIIDAHAHGRRVYARLTSSITESVRGWPQHCPSNSIAAGPKSRTRRTYVGRVLYFKTRRVDDRSTVCIVRGGKCR